jgi:type VI secretion system secreted protein Hcp
VAIADMFLKLTGITGEAQDSGHKGEIQVVSWSWWLSSPMTAMATGSTRKGATALAELVIVKRVDLATPSLMNLVRTNKPVTSAVLTVRKAGATPHEYFRIELGGVLVSSVMAHSESQDLFEQVSMAFQKVKVVYSPQQSATGAKGGGDVTFEADAYAGA